MSGTLYILGVGPGGQGLVTVRAAEILQRMKRIFIPVSGQGRDSYAYSNAGPFIPSDAVVSELEFPMTTDRERLSAAYKENCKLIENVVRAESEAALLTLGDPCTYSSASQIANMLRQQAPDIKIEIIPGITSFAAAAARAGLPLAEGSEILAVVSSYDRPERIEKVLHTADTVVFLKTYAQRDAIVEILRKKNLLHDAVYVRRAGLAGEEVISNLDELPEEKDYLSMIIVKKKNYARG